MDIQLGPFFSFTRDIVVVFTKEGHFYKVNAAWEKTFGLLSDALKGRHFSEFIHLDDLADSLSGLQILHGNEDVEGYVNRFRCEDGSYRWLEWRAHPQGDFLYCLVLDVSERKLDEHRLKLVLGSVDIGLWDWSIERDELYFDETFCAQLGFQKNELESAPSAWKKLVHPDDLNAFEEALYLCQEKNGGAYELDIRMRHKDGRWLRILSRGDAANWDVDGRALHIIGAHLDITERYRARERERSRARVMELVATGASRSEILDALVRGIKNETACNACSVALLDKTGEHLKLVSCAPNLPDSFKDGFFAGVKRLDEAGGCGKAVITGELVVIEDVLTDPLNIKLLNSYRKAGTKSSWSKPIYNSKGETLGTFAMHSDRGSVPTEDELEVIEYAAKLAGIAIECDLARKTLEEGERNLRYGEVIAKMGYWKLIPDTGEVITSAQFHRNWGRGSELLSQDKFFSSMLEVGDESSVRVKALIEKCIATGIDWDQEHRMAMSDGTFQWVRNVGNFIPQNGENTACYMGVLQDISAQKKQEEIIRRSQRMDALGKLTGGIAHDYNNLLSIILGFSELLRMRLSDEPKLLEYVEKIHDAGERAGSLTKKLLGFSKHQPASTAVVDLNALLGAQKQILENCLGASVKLEFNTQAMLWPVQLDSGDFENAVINMGANARDAMTEGTLTLMTRNVSLSEEAAAEMILNAGEYVCLSIMDTGSGIDSEVQQRIFDPFYTTKGALGTGLGLSQVYGFVQRSGGDISVTSIMGRGTRFDLYFPRDTSESPVKAENAAEPVVLEKVGVLVVDDELALRELSREYLSLAGYQVYCAGSAEEALSILRENSVDLMLSDVLMPGLNGYQLAAIVAEEFPQVKVQLCSGYSGAEQNVNTDPELLEHMLMKPIRPSVLLERLEQLLLTETDFL